MIAHAQKTQSEVFSGLAMALGRNDAVSVSPEAISSHSHDWWPMNATWRHQNKAPYQPEAVVYVKSPEEVARALNWAAANKVPVTAWGMASSVVGGPLATRGGIVLDTTGMNRVICIDAENMHVTAEAGVNGGELEDMLSARGLTLNHSPQSLYRSTVGGWLATRATGQFSSRYGGIEDLCVGFTAVLLDGTIVKVGGAPRMAVGPDLRHVMIGSEGSLGVITDVTLRLFPKREARRFESITFPDVPSGVAAMRAMMLSGIKPFLMRYYDVTEARHAMKDKAFDRPVMFLGTEGSTAMADLEMQELLAICKLHGGVAIGPEGAEGWMGRRFDFSTVEKILDEPGGVAETIEVANTWSGIQGTYDALTEAMAPFADEVLGHFSHAYTDGVSLYVILLGQTDTPAAAEKRMADIWQAAMEATLATGGVLSHHHGTGLARSRFVPEALGTSWPLLQRIKNSLDPDGLLNPGKLGF